MENKKYTEHELGKFLKADLVTMIREMQSKGEELISFADERFKEEFGDICHEGTDLLVQAHDAFKLPRPMEEFELTVIAILPKGAHEGDIDSILVTLVTGEQIEHDYVENMDERS